MLKPFFAILKILIIGGIGVQTFSCAKKPPIDAYYSTGGKVSLPDSARVKAVVSASQNDKQEKLSAVLFAVPNKKYRLELSSSFGLSAASILWKDGSWKIVIPQEERYMEGNGNCVSIPIYGSVDIHQFALLFFGQRTDSLSCSEWDVFKLEYTENSALISSDGESLKLEIKDVDSKAKWSESVWRLNVPDKFVRISR